MKKQKTLEQYKDMGASSVSLRRGLPVECGGIAVLNNSGRNSRRLWIHWCICITD